jgi:hypothetical protein
MGEDLALPIQREVKAVLPGQSQGQYESNEAPAKLFSIGREGAGACTMVAYFKKRFLGRM